MFSQKDFNICQIRCRELLKDYDMSVLYHLCKANAVADVLSQFCIVFIFMFMIIRESWFGMFIVCVN